MIKGTRQGPRYATYTFGEQEFKDLLGIEDPSGVLTADVSFTAQSITVTDTAEKTWRLAGISGDRAGWPGGYPVRVADLAHATANDDDLNGDTDIRNWAERFVARAAEHPGIPADTGAMMAWFAGAMAAARDASRGLADITLNGHSLIRHNAAWLCRLCWLPAGKVTDYTADGTACRAPRRLALRSYTARMGTSFAGYLAASKTSDNPADTAFRADVAAGLTARLAAADGAAFRVEADNLDVAGFPAGTLDVIGVPSPPESC